VWERRHRAEDYKEYRKYHHTSQQPMGACHPKRAARIIPIVISIGEFKALNNHSHERHDTGDVERENSPLFQGN
jgi:hypothetical protein